MSYEQIIRRNLEWFCNSGVLAEEGIQGVHERIWLLDKDHPLVNGNKLHKDGVFTYRRVDCALETALTFSLASKVLGDESFGAVAQNLLRFTQFFPFQERRIEHSEYGLYAHGLTFKSALPQSVLDSPTSPVRRYGIDLCFWDKKWVDDNGWAAIIPFALSGKSFDKETLLSTLILVNALVDKKDLLAKYCKNQLDGVHIGAV